MSTPTPHPPRPVDGASGPIDGPINGPWAFERYEAVRARLPSADFAGVETRHAANLSAIAEHYDAFLLDGFGVLNVGLNAIPGAGARMRDLVAAGKRLVVLTNGATQSLRRATEKYARMGFEFGPESIVSSRAVAVSALERHAPAGRDGAPLWGVATGREADMGGVDARTVPLRDDPEPYETAEAFLLLSSADWSMERHERLAEALRRRPRPVVCANPDVVAPFADGFSLEPGHFAHDLADRGLAEPVHYGKPFPLAFEHALERLAGVPRDRIAMVGDTLHTDILGGRAAGLATVLVAGHGLFRGHDPLPFIERSGIWPDWIVETT